MTAIIEKHRRVFGAPSGVPPSRGIYDFNIKLKAGAAPVLRSQYRLSLAERRALRDELNKKMTLGWLTNSLSAWSSPVQFARNRRKDQKLFTITESSPVLEGSAPRKEIF